MKNNKSYLNNFVKDICDSYPNIIPIPEDTINNIKEDTYSIVFVFEISSIKEQDTQPEEKKILLLNTSVGFVEDHERAFCQGTDSNYRFYLKFNNSQKDNVLQKYFQLHKAKSLFAVDECRIYYKGDSSRDVVRNIKSEITLLEKYLLENSLKLNFLYANL